MPASHISLGSAWPNVRIEPDSFTCEAGPASRHLLIDTFERIHSETRDLVAAP